MNAMPVNDDRRTLLDQLENDIRQQMTELRDTLRAEEAVPYQDVADRKDVADNEMVAGTDRARLALLEESLGLVERARERLARGIYGTCADCGQTIPLARLRIEPTATRCIDCQGRRESPHAVA